MRFFVEKKREWETVADFLRDAFELVYDVDPLEEIMVLKDVSTTGYQTRMYIDGDLICTILFFDPDGKQVNSFSWQGPWRVENVTMETFQKELHQALENCEQKNSKPIHF